MRSVKLIGLLVLATSAVWADEESYSDSPGVASTIINRYVEASENAIAKNQPVEIDIDASVPKLNQHAKLRALRKISEVGKITYRVLGFQGDKTVKNQVITRYLQAEQQGQNDSRLKLIPANYKFKYKGEKAVDGRDIYVFQVSPRAKRLGLFKGEVWLDSATYLPVMEKGRLVKNPSIFFRRVEFERDFSILNGVAVPARVSSTILTRIVGRVNLNVAYSSPTDVDVDSLGQQDARAIPSSY